MTPHFAVNLPCPKAVILAIMIDSVKATDPDLKATASECLIAPVRRARLFQLTLPAM
jgi:hypothetical protein